MTVQISIEQLVASIVREVVAELARRGVTVTGAPAPGAPPAPPAPATAVEIDLSGYRTPVLTEGHVSRLPPGVASVIIPCATVLTPGARDLIRQKKVSIVRKAQSH